MTENESIDDFDSCQCGGNLTIINILRNQSNSGSEYKQYTRISMSAGKTFTEKKAEEYREKQNQPVIKKISSEKKLDPSFENEKSVNKFGSDEKLENLYKRAPSKIFDPLYIAIGLLVIIIGVALFLFSLLSMIVIFVGILLLAYGAYDPKNRYTPANSENDFYFKTEYKKETNRSWVKGLRGENIVLNQLNTLPQNFFVFHDVKLPKGQGNIDHIVIGPTGLFVIETKNYSGNYQINGNQWYYYKNGKYNLIKNKNPGIQLIRNIMNLKSFLADSGIKKSQIYAYGIVAFIQNNYSIKKKPDNYQILRPTQIPEYIQSRKKPGNLEILGKIVQEIEPYCTEFTYAPKTED